MRFEEMLEDGIPCDIEDHLDRSVQIFWDNEDPQLDIGDFHYRVMMSELEAHKALSRMFDYFKTLKMVGKLQYNDEEKSE
jgi:hypothetical protein